MCRIKCDDFIFPALFPKDIIIFARMKKKELTAADVWAMFAESDRRMQETERMMQENAVLIKELSIQIGGITDLLIC
jgi:hypothetical protein